MIKLIVNLLKFIFFIIEGIIKIILYLGIFALVFVPAWMLFEKKRYPGWYSLIPVYNYYIAFCRIGNAEWWTLLLLLIPGVNLFVLYYLNYKFVSAYGSGALMALLTTFLPFIGLPILAYQNRRGGIRRRKF